VVWLTRQLASSGSLYTFAGASFGPLGGVITGWAMLLAYGIGAPAAVVIIEIYADKVFNFPETGIVHSIIYLVVLVSGFLFALRDVKLSVIFSLVVESISIVLVTSLGIIALVHHGPHLDFQQLGLHGTNVTMIREGLVLAAGIFAGFEGCAVLGFEAKNPHRTIPIALLSTVVAIGVYVIFMAYAEIVGFEGSGLSFAQQEAPLDTLAQVLGVSGLGRLISLGLTVGLFGAVIGMLNAGSRIIYTMARDGILPAPLGRVHPRFKTPYVALALLAIPAWVIPFAFIVSRTPVEKVNAYLGTFETFGFIVAYFLISIAASVFLYKRNELRPYHVVVSFLAAGMMAFVLAGQIYPVPPAPFSFFPYLTALYFAAGVIFYVVLKARAPHLAAQVGDTVNVATSNAS
jgi:amino acid transporter